MPQKLLIIVPCYNEQAALPQLLTGLKLLKISGYEIAIVVVNDCSTDGSLLIAQQHNVKVINLPINLGIGGAVQSGLIYAHKNSFDLAVQMDGDGQHPPAELVKLLKCYEDSGANLVIGSRFINREGFQSTFTRRLGIAYFHWLNKLFTGKDIYDSTSGFRLFDRKAIELAAESYPDEYPEPESLVLFSRAGLHIKETPVLMDSRKGGASSIGKRTSLYYCIKVSMAMLFAAMRKSL